MTMVQKTYENGKTVSSIARKNGVIPSQLFYPRRRTEDGAITAVGPEEEVVPPLALINKPLASPEFFSRKSGLFLNVIITPSEPEKFISIIRQKISRRS